MPKWRRKRSLTKRWQKNHLIQKYGNICHICNEPFKSLKEITLDHYLPLSKGGWHEIENLRLAHYDCNQMKGGMTPEEFRKAQEGDDDEH